MLRGSTHGDMKPEDILIDLFGCAHIGIAKVSDSEASISRQKNMRFNKSISHEDPIPLDIIASLNDERNSLDSKTDIYNLGLTFLYTLDPESFNSKKSLEGLFKKIGKKVPPAFLELLKEMSSSNPANRPSIMNVASYFAKCLGQSLPVKIVIYV